LLRLEENYGALLGLARCQNNIFLPYSSNFRKRGFF
jgi:hypothetical protein